MAAATPICTQEEWSLLVLVSSACLVLRSSQTAALCWAVHVQDGCPFSYCPTCQTSPKTPSQTQPESVSYWFTKHSWTQAHWQSQLTIPPYQQPYGADAFASGLWGLAKLKHGRTLHSQSRTLWYCLSIIPHRLKLSQMIIDTTIDTFVIMWVGFYFSWLDI